MVIVQIKCVPMPIKDIKISLKELGNQLKELREERNVATNEAPVDPFEKQMNRELMQLDFERDKLLKRLEIERIQE